MTSEQAAYLAGIIDGEGHLLFANPGRGKGRPRPQIEVSSTTPELIEWLKETCGGYCPRTIERGGSRRPEYRWRASSETARNLLRQALPYMILVKKRELAGRMLRGA